MHWYWIDRFILFESPKRAKALKLVTLAEEYLHDHFPHFPVMPASLIIEGVAQAGGLLVGEANDYRENVVLGKLPRFEFHNTIALPGDVLTYSVDVINISREGAMVSATVHNNGKLMAEGELVFAHLQKGFTDTALFNEGSLIDMMRIFGVYEIGVDADGNRLVDPAKKTM
ncbi:MAG: beta-hydroxyacyl-ACP dehydratase [Planctomycetaceae bacterium]|jgi:3-hydroxyacyl-[acyl-carrier-protein] dehydratase|nr:beta-hydroxyacyl-ACP dehydratase [Planctomycetaceae bacterium]